MIKKIKNLRIDLLDCGNEEKDDNLRNEICWISDPDARKREIKSIISFVSDSAFNYPQIYTNFRRLDFWKEEYIENDSEGFDFETELKEILKDDASKLIVKYSHWSQVNQKLPAGSYLSCVIPTSYWYRCGKNEFDKMILEWDN
jgi:hypothetical protein